MLPITANEVSSSVKKIKFLDKKPKKNPSISAKTILRFPYKKTFFDKIRIITQTIIATSNVVIT